MGQSSRPRPARLAQKLLELRESLGLSQNQIIDRLGLSGELTQSRVSSYERNVREPLLTHLLLYARRCLGSGAYLENLIDDELELPEDTASPPLNQRPTRQKTVKSTHQHQRNRKDRKRES